MSGLFLFVHQNRRSSVLEDICEYTEVQVLFSTIAAHEGGFGQDVACHGGQEGLFDGTGRKIKHGVQSVELKEIAVLGWRAGAAVGGFRP